ncbi:MAG: HEAT repeat domain-containing protein [Gemmatimonadetes bacterium]|nr:HEAT repeat domain-containing protein [Gemmatimonadota bacterium]
MPGIPDAGEVERSWRAAADEVGGHYGLTPRQSIPYIRVATPGHQIVLQLLYTGSGYRTSVRAPFHDPGGLSLVITDESGLGAFFKKLGFTQDIEIGRTDFDDRFLVRGHPVAHVRRLLAPPVPDHIVAQPFIDLRITGALFGESYPRGISEVVIHRSRIVRPTAQLVGLVEVARALVTRLDPLGTVETTDLEELLTRLARPRGRVVDIWSGIVLWDGDPPRRDSVRRLGERGDVKAVPALIEALGDPDPALVVDAIRALDAIGDPSAVPGLVRLLGRRRDHVEDEPLSDHAGRALRAFGEEALVDAVERALAGDRTGLLEAVGALREPAIEAFMRVLDSFDLDARVEAAVVLGELGARQALPLLRDKSWAMGLRTKLADASRAAIDAIEAQASLPRPASAAPPTPQSAQGATLPRPAQPRGSGTGATLPRPVDEPDARER